jgi:hypothetical protein
MAVVVKVLTEGDGFGCEGTMFAGKSWERRRAL